MASNEVTNPLEFFVNQYGDALESGKIYIGQVGLDPVTNPKTAYFDQALTITAAQPIRTVAGVPSLSGAAKKIFTNGSYSVKVTDQNDVLIYTSLVEGVLDATGGNEVDTFADLDALTAADVAVGDYVRVTSIGATYQAVSSGQHITTAGGLKLVVLPGASGYDVRAFGAVGDGVTDDTDAIQAADAAAAVAKSVLLFPAGVYDVSARSAPIAPTTTWVGESSWYDQFSIASPIYSMPDKGTVIDGGATNLDILSANWTARNIEGINIRGSGTGACIHMTSGSRLSRVFNCAFYGKENAVKISGSVAYVLRFDRIFASRQTSHAVHFDWGTGAFNDISLTNSWLNRPDGNGVNATGSGGGCTILNISNNSITDGTGSNAAILVNGVAGLRIISNDIEGWGAIYPDPDVLSGKTGYQANALAMQITGNSIVIEGNVTYGGGNSNSPIKLLTARQVRIGTNRLLKDLSTQTYAISVDSASQDVVIDPQTFDYPSAASISASATDVINNSTGQPDFLTPITASKNVVFPTPSTVASASTITLPDAPVVKISGTTNISFITGKPYQIITLEFEGVLTVLDSPPGSGNLRLNGDFTTSAASTLTLMSRGASASWVEISRSLNT